MWITNGAINDTELGDAFLIYARTGNSGKGTADFSSFIVEKNFNGFSLGQRIKVNYIIVLFRERSCVVTYLLARIN